MNCARSVLLAAASSFAFVLVPAYAADEQKEPPGFNELDKDDDGSLTKSEAAGNPTLASQFATVDRDGDSKLSRVEYLRTMAQKDMTALRERASEVIEPDAKASTGSSSSTGGSSSAGGSK
jgi:Ca2+-binding EF-hand superfamily protein